MCSLERFATRFTPAMVKLYRDIGVREREPSHPALLANLVNRHEQYRVSNSNEPQALHQVVSEKTHVSD